MKHLRCAASYVLHSIGHVVSKPMCRYSWAGGLYPLYNRLMLASHRLDTGDCGIWERPSGPTSGDAHG